MPQPVWLQADIETLQQMMQEGTLSAEQLVNDQLALMASIDQSVDGLNAICDVNPEALSIAAQLDQERRAQGPRSALHGITVVVKDNFETQEMTTQAGSALLAGFNPGRDSFQVARLRQAGAIILGKTNMHEFAYGITTIGSRFGQSRNAHVPTRNPGGSSGGSGAAVAARLAIAGMGSDTCGSIRIPAAHNNLVGLRGTQGISSRRGIVPLSSSQDIGGPLARSVRDLAIMLDHSIGYDAQDAQTADSVGQLPPSLRNALQARDGLRVGLLADWLHQEPGDEAVAAVIEQALAVMQEAAGWQIKSVPSPEVNAALDRPLNGHFVLIYDFKRDIERYFADNPDLGFSNLAHLIAAGGHHPDIEESLQASAAMQAEHDDVYRQELAQRQVVRRALLRLMASAQVDVLAYPTIRREAAPLGEPQFGTNCRLSANSGLPAITVPAGFTAAGLPVGLELLGPAWSESLLLGAAAGVERWHPQVRLPTVLDE